MNPILVLILIFGTITLFILSAAILLNITEFGILLVGKIFNLDTKIENERPTELYVTTKIIEDNRNIPAISGSIDRFLKS